MFAPPKFTAPAAGTLREVLDDDTTTRDKNSLNRLGVIKGGSGGVDMMLKTGTEVTQDYNFFKYGTPRPQKHMKYQDRTTVAGPGANLAPLVFVTGNRK